MNRLRRLLDVARTRRHARGAAAPRSVDRPRPGLLHRHDLRDVPERPARDRQRLLRRPLRQPGRPYTKQALPGVGASLGLDRLLAAMEELKLLPEDSDAGPGAGRAVQRRPPRRLPEDGPAAAGRGHRRRGLSRGEKVGQQLKYAEQRGFRVALIAGPDEFAQGVWKVKDLARREETTCRRRRCRGGCGSCWPIRASDKITRSEARDSIRNLA